MRIEPKVTTPVTAPTTAEARSAKPEAAVKHDTSSVVQLSAGATAAASATPGASHGITARLATIKTQLATGTYPVDLDRLANRVVDDDVLRARGGGSKGT